MVLTKRRLLTESPPFEEKSLHCDLHKIDEDHLASFEGTTSRCTLIVAVYCIIGLRIDLISLRTI